MSKSIDCNICQSENPGLCSAVHDDMMPHVKSLDDQIEEKEHAIKMYGYDVWGSSAFSNMEIMDRLRTEIKNLKEYGREYPTRWQRVKSWLKHTG